MSGRVSMGVGGEEEGKSEDLTHVSYDLRLSLGMWVLLFCVIYFTLCCAPWVTGSNHQVRLVSWASEMHLLI